ncbi:hypothetical protein ACIO3O_34595 [Streptomyces sp. NPDC087440]|uniref:hypothetical protein n=1 Tax=Streptomyces sp. NPDC087440 TaxID=3365790 RepID=UPI003820A007
MTTEAPSPPDATVRREAADTVAALNRQLSAAGLGLISIDVAFLRNTTPYFKIAPFDDRTAANLSAVLKEFLRPAHMAAAHLQEALTACGLSGFSTPTVRAGSIALDSVSVPTADQFATLLGAPPAEDDLPAEDVLELSESGPLIERLIKGVSNATQGGVLRVTFHPDCSRGCGDPLVDLGSLDVLATQHLAEALLQGAHQ